MQKYGTAVSDVSGWAGSDLMFANFRRIRAISMRFEFAEDQILRTCLAAASGGVEVSAWILVCWFDSL
jgi:hypothetical protein